jgi:ornithine cyclodeaminase/alanine dehydrogenase-like protein (mu-crystallin family)
MPTQLAVIDADQTCDALPFARLIPVLRQAFAGGAKVPARHHHHIVQPDGTTAVLLLMPAWQDQGYLGVKIVTIFPGNSARGLPGLDSSYLLCDGQTGRHLALIDGNQITARRTVGVAALAASYLARQDATSLLLVGAGRVASLAAEAFRMVRPIRTVAVWNRDRAKAAKLVEALQGRGFDAVIAPSLREAAGEVDIISCATLSTEPLIQADWLKPGTHLDLIGSFTPAMREADDACLARGRVYVDSLDALVESGDLVDPIRNGILTPAAIAGTLGQLCAGGIAGRGTADEITVFKAVGTALSDIAAGALVYRTVQGVD